MVGKGRRAQADALRREPAFGSAAFGSADLRAAGFLAAGLAADLPVSGLPVSDRVPFLARLALAASTLARSV
jgi:hypothetical protein